MIRAWFVCASLLAAAAGFAQTPVSAPPAAEPPAGAAAPAPAPRVWGSLSLQQQQLLQSHQGEWNSLPPERQQALAMGSERWLSMTPQQRAGAQQRFRSGAPCPLISGRCCVNAGSSTGRCRLSGSSRCGNPSTGSGKCRRKKRTQLRQQWRQMTPEQRHHAGQQMHAPPPQHRPPR